MAKEVVEKTVTKTVTKKSGRKRAASKIKSSPRKKITIKKESLSHSRTGKIDRAIVENFVALQKVLTNLSVKFDDLGEKIGRLLDVFEISAKSLAEKDFKDFIKINDEEVLKKLDDLLEQNKVIAKGLIMMHEKTYGPRKEYIENIQQYKKIPQNMAQSSQKIKKQNIEDNVPLPPPSDEGRNFLPDNLDEYTKSIASPTKDS